MSTGLGDKLYSSYYFFVLTPKRSRILSSGRKLNSGSCLDTSIIDPGVHKIEFLVSGHLASVKYSSATFILSISLSELSNL